MSSLLAYPASDPAWPAPSLRVCAIVGFVLAGWLFLVIAAGGSGIGLTGVNFLGRSVLHGGLTVAQSDGKGIEADLVDGGNCLLVYWVADNTLL